MGIDTRFSLESFLTNGSIVRGRVHGIDQAGHLLVNVRGELYECDVLHSTSGQDALLIGSTVLLFRSDDCELPVVLGQVGPLRPPSEPVTAEIPDTLFLEAKDSLTLRVGDGSITIRSDGKILIKGKDLVSHAKNLNRIKGGAVAIN